MSIKTSVISAALLFVAQTLVALPSFGQEATEVERLRKAIEEQERRFDAQDMELGKQKQALQELRKQLQSLQGGGQNVATSPVATQAPDAEHPGFEGLNQAIEAAQTDWPGSFGVPGSDTRIKISGFAELDVMHDSDAIQTPGVFVPGAIETRGATAAEKGYNQTNFTIQSTRLSVETRTPLQNHQFTTFIAADFLSDLNTIAAELHVRQAYGELTNILFGGDLRFGQDWATFTNVDTIPNVLDAQGPNALFATRHPLARWTRKVGSELKLMLAAESTDAHLFQGATSVSRWPDGVVALLWERDSALLQGGFLARDLRASDSSGQVDAAFGWGANLAGRLHMPGKLTQDFISFSITYGDGIGGVINDGPPDAIFNPATQQLETIPTLAWFAGYQHWWNHKFFTVLSYGEVVQDNLDIQDPTAYYKTQYSSANLSWTPFEQWLYGVEVLYGTREDKDGANGSDIRSLFVTRFNF